jgi:hypothetical protein
LRKGIVSIEHVQTVDSGYWEWGGFCTVTGVFRSRLLEANCLNILCELLVMFFAIVEVLSPS